MCPIKKEVTKAWILKKVEKKNDEKGSNPDEEDSTKREGKQDQSKGKGK